MQQKTNHTDNKLTRRRFVNMSVMGSTATLLLPGGLAFGKNQDTLKVGLIGCGDRGTGAGIIDCAASSAGIELIAMGDLFEDHMRSAPEKIKANLQKRGLSVKDIYKVTPETTFTGFDANKKVLACDVDMVILTTPPNFRPQHLRAAVEAGKHVFLEKPVAVDPVGVRSVIESAGMAKEKGLSVVAGTQLRRMQAFREAVNRIHNGDIGEITGGQVVRTGGGMLDWMIEEKEQRPGWTDMEYHIRRWLFWTWLSGDFIAEQHVHNLDIMNWILQSHPVKCVGVGGRQVRTGKQYGDIYDHLAVEYEYPNEVRIQYIGSQIDGYPWRGDERVAGTRGSAHLFGNNGIIKGSAPWQFEGDQPDPSVLQFTEMIDSIRKGNPINEGRQIAESTLTALMGRMSAYAGKEVEWDWAMNDSTLDLSPKKMEFGDMPEMPVQMPGVTELI
ncbi:MAG: Gfo/Idh/MocA family oxidoreductase [Bacteroidales bacterium]